MPDQVVSMAEPTGGFKIHDRTMLYNVFVPRLYNWCKSLGFEPGKIMPSRAFCSDENQGYPAIMIAKHFGTFPFNHGRVGGIVATGRHGPHAAHGQDLVIVQSSHVGYDPETRQFGIYRRAQTKHGVCSPSCGKVQNVVTWYQNEYDFARQNILLHNDDGNKIVIVDNQLLREERDEGLFLHLEKIICPDEAGHWTPLNMLSTARAFTPTQDFVDRMGEAAFNRVTPQPMGTCLNADMFYFRRDIPPMEEGAHHLEYNLIRYMPQIVTSASPALTAAEINTQVEFDRTFRSIVKEQAYKGKKLLFIAGLNIDISPEPGQLFPLTKFVPWAACVQDRDGYYFTLEQQELVQTLELQNIENPDQIDLESAIAKMDGSTEIIIER